MYLGYCQTKKYDVFGKIEIQGFRTPNKATGSLFEAVEG
jgi:hypothetical protein